MCINKYKFQGAIINISEFKFTICVIMSKVVKHVYFKLSINVGNVYQVHTLKRCLTWHRTG